MGLIRIISMAVRLGDSRVDLDPTIWASCLEVCRDLCKNPATKTLPKHPEVPLRVGHWVLAWLVWVWLGVSVLRVVLRIRLRVPGRESPIGGPE